MSRSKASGRGSIAGLSFEGKLSDITQNIADAELHFTTVVPRGTNRHGLDVVSSGYFLVGLADRVVEAGSTDGFLVVTAHDFKKGDLVRLKTTANTIAEDEIFVKKVIDANTVEFDGLLSDVLTAGDTLDVLRGVSPLYGSDGSIVVTATQTPVQIKRGPGGVYSDVEVTKDTTVDANTVPMPVEIVGAAGTTVNITAGDVGVQLFHNTANPDSVQVGDGTEILLISTAGEALTQPNGNVADNAADAGNPVKVGGVYNTAAQVYADGDRADLQLDVNGRLLVSSISIGSTNSSFAEDSAHTTGDDGSHTLAVRQDTLASSTSADGDYASLKSNSLGELYTSDTTAIARLTTIAGLDFATETTLSALNAKFNSLGQKARAASAPVTLSTEDITLIGTLATETTLSTLNGKFGTIGQKTSGGSAPVVLSSEQEVFLNNTSTRLTSLDGKDFSTETTLAALSAKFNSLGQKTAAASAPVVLASDQNPLAVDNGDVIDPTALFGLALNDNAGAFVQLLAASSADAIKIQIMQKGGEPLQLALGAAASETVKMIVMPGGSPDTIVPVTIPAGSRLSARSASGNAIAAVDIFFNLIG